MSIHVRHLQKRFGSFVAVDDVTFHTERGEITALLGPSGSGKSTVLRVIAGLERPDAGEVEIDGEDSTSLSPASRGVGFVFQHYALFRHLTVAENVGFGLSVRHVSRSEIDARVKELLELVQLHGYGGRYPTQLSGGQRQRVALARALAPRPRVLLLDEPFGALDAHVRADLRAWLRRLHDEIKMTTLIVTHDQEEAMELSDRVVVMNKGSLEQVGTPDELFDAPRTSFVAGFIGGANRLKGEVRAGAAEVEGHPLPPRAEGWGEAPRFEAFVRPQDLEIRAQGGDTGGNELPVKVERLTRLGWQVKVDVRLASGKILSLQRAKDQIDVLGLRTGQWVNLRLRDVRIFPVGEDEGASHQPQLLA